jgi:hypothetical protein
MVNKDFPHVSHSTNVIVIISPNKNNYVHNIKRKKVIFQPAVLTQVEIYYLQEDYFK